MPTEIIAHILGGFSQKFITYNIALVSRRWRLCSFDPMMYIYYIYYVNFLRTATFKDFIRRPELLTDEKILGLIDAYNTRRIWNFKGCKNITQLSMMVIK